MRLTLISIFLCFPVLSRHLKKYRSSSRSLILTGVEKCRRITWCFLGFPLIELLKSRRENGRFRHFEMNWWISPKLQTRVWKQMGLTNSPWDSESCITWEKKSLDAPMTFMESSEREIPLKNGRFTSSPSSSFPFRTIWGPISRKPLIKYPIMQGRGREKKSKIHFLSHLYFLDRETLPYEGHPLRYLFANMVHSEKRRHVLRK